MKPFQPINSSPKAIPGKLFGAFFGFLTIFAIAITSCSRVTPNGDEEAVLIMKPLFFGHGGVSEKPVAAGSEWISPTTDYVMFKITPETYTILFDDMMTDDNTPVDFSAYLKVQIQKGKTPILYEKFGEKWFENSISPTYRALVRDKASSYKMFDLTSNREVLINIETQVYEQMASYCKKLNLPVDIQQVTIGAVTPPNEVLEETRRTAAQNQSILTQRARAESELARKQAEINKAIADLAYKSQMNMTIQEYLQLRNLEIEKEKVELVRDKQNVSIIMGQGINPMYNVK
jgi:regulator of protease activity HflC (stomatin/prohibitin superfamily)